MEVKAVSIIIERDPMTKIPKVIPAWELEIYQVKYPGKIEVVGESVISLDGLEDAETEADRLRNLLGADDKSGLVFFDDVYGRGRAGTAEFEKAIRAALVRPAQVADQYSASAMDADAAGAKDSEGAGASMDPLDDPA